jgi:adenylate cyclase
MTEQGFKRKLAAILSADVEGYSRLMDDDEEATVRTLTSYRTAIADLVQQFRGRVVDTPGDNILTEFTSVVDAVNCAVEIQRDLAERNTELPYNRQMQFRIGVNLGDVIEEDGRIYGDGINIAARMEGLAEKGGICVTEAVHEQVKNKLKVGFLRLGKRKVKNIAEPIQVYRVESMPHSVSKAIKKQPLRGRGTRLPLPDKPSVAVLPFDNLTGDKSQEYIADGITESIITALSKIGELFVIARHSVFTYKDKHVSVQQVGQDLGVHYVLEGSVLKAGKRIRITVQLVDAITGHYLWTEQFDRESKDFFEILDEVALNTAVALQAELGEGEHARGSLGTQDFQAWGYYMKGVLHFQHFTHLDNTKARELFTKATEADQEFALAWLMLAWTYFIDVRFGFSKSPDKSIRRAVEIGTKAISCDDQMSEIHSFWNTIYLVQGQFEKAIAEGKKAIELSPNNAMGYLLLAQTMRFVGKFEEAIYFGEKSIRLSPRFPAWYLVVIAPAYIEAERYDRAISILQEALERSHKGEIPSSHVLQHLAVTYIRLGQEDKAKSCADELIKSDPSFTLEANSEQLFYKDPKLTRAYLDDLRKAGLK